MRQRRGKRRSHRESVTSEIDLMPMLNVFISIIPLLLLGAAFVPVTVIKTTLPSDQAAADTQDAPLDLAVHIHPAAYQLEINGSIVQSIARDPRANDAAKAEAHEALSQALKSIAAAHTGDREVRIVSESRTRYEEIVEVMDSARG